METMSREEAESAGLRGHLQSSGDVWAPVEKEPSLSGAPTSAVFDDGNGGEYREPCTSLLCPCPYESVIDAWACAQTATALAALPPPRARTQAWAGSTRTRWSLCTPAWRRVGRRRAAR